MIFSRFVRPFSVALISVLVTLSPAAAQSTTPGKTNATPKPAAAGKAQFAASSWNVNCKPDAQAKKLICEIYQSITVKKTGRLLMRVSLGGTPRRMIMQLPHGLDLTTGVRLQIDNKPTQLISFNASTPKGVFTTMVLSADLMAMLTKGQKMKVSVVSSERS